MTVILIHHNVLMMMVHHVCGSGIKETTMVWNTVKLWTVLVAALVVVVVERAVIFRIQPVMMWRLVSYNNYY
jgi:hypothetical protein